MGYISDDTLNEIFGPSAADIISLRLRIHVFEHIDFELPGWLWHEIDDLFAIRWNNIGVGNYFFWSEITPFIHNELKKKKLLLPYQHLEKIIYLMLEEFEKMGMMLD